MGNFENFLVDNSVQQSLRIIDVYRQIQVLIERDKQGSNKKVFGVGIGKGVLSGVVVQGVQVSRIWRYCGFFWENQIVNGCVRGRNKRKREMRIKYLVVLWFVLYCGELVIRGSVVFIYVGIGLVCGQGCGFSFFF